MNGWLDQLHGGSTAFPPVVTAIKLAVALAIGLLIGFERQWSHKDFGVRTFSLTALLGALTALISTLVMLMGMLATVLLAVLLNVRDIVASRSVEGTTSVALVVTFVLGALIGNGHMFTSVACASRSWFISVRRMANKRKAEQRSRATSTPKFALRSHRQKRTQSGPSSRAANSPVKPSSPRAIRKASFAKCAAIRHALSTTPQSRPSATMESGRRSRSKGANRRPSPTRQGFAS
jgi:uncharacterized membrane protein YhiD involved in acid resistance